MSMRLLFCVSVTLSCSAMSQAQEDVPVDRYNVRTTDGLTVTVRLGADGARGGNQLLLLFQMEDGSTRKFDLNRTREEWAANSARTMDITVQPPIVYADIARVGIEWHGSRGDVFQEQDDMDLDSMVIGSKATGASAVIMNGRPVSVKFIENVRLENDQTYWAGGVSPRIQNAVVCASDRDCDDGLFCNGAEHCAPGDPNATMLGCVVQPSPCSAGSLCDEAADNCGIACVDSDGDGHLSVACGGDDCDDTNSNRYPGNIELFDAADQDEDCDPNTHGFYRGASSSQICDGRESVLLVDSREQFTQAHCAVGTVCVPQPNGEGVCMGEPPGYQAPGPAAAPRGPQQMPRGGSSLKNPVTIPGTKLTPQSPGTERLNLENLQPR